MKNIFLIGLIIVLFTGCLDQDDIPTFEQQLAADIVLIEKFLSDNNIDAEVHNSEIRYIRTEEGTGSTPEVNGSFVAKFTGSIMGGDKFVESKYGSSFLLNTDLLPAWQIMVQELQEGGKLTMYAPSVYCFGISSTSLIPANSILTFDLELVRVVDDAEEQFTADTIIINEYLADINIDPLEHSSGIRYTIEEEGTGNGPEPQDDVEVKYTGYFTDGTIFDSNEDGVTFGLGNLIEAWQIMIPEIKPGGKMTIYAPSKFCYGPEGSSSIPPNTVLKFEIELISVK